MKTKLFSLFLLAVVAAAVYAGNVLATPSSGLTTPELWRAAFGEINLHAGTTPADDWHTRIRTLGSSDVYVVHNKLEPGATTGWHSHPGPSLILVVSGTVTNYAGDDPTCTGRSYSAGTGFVDEGGADVHMVRNEGTTSAETIAVQFLPNGAQRRIDQPDPGNCHF